MYLPKVILLCFAGLLSFPFIGFSVISLIEEEYFAAKRSSLVAVVFASFFTLSALSNSIFVERIGIGVGAIIMLFLLALLLPIRKKKSVAFQQNDYRFDERNTMFSRLEIGNRADKKEIYYKDNPENVKIDESWRKKPGLLNAKASQYHNYSFAAADASFFTIGQLKPFVNAQVKKPVQDSDSNKNTTFVKQWALKLGAKEVGVCETKPYHFYSTRGRGKAYGDKVELKHKYAIAVTVEMDKFLLGTGPSAPTLMESAQQYLNSGVIAIQLAQFIGNMGYEARAHIDGDYELICPLVARDAGLGDIGRMGLLITKNLGPRVRIAVVTTNFPLIADTYRQENSVKEFCTLCKKCAEVCPSQAISKGDQSIINDNIRWQINQEKCFDYWCTTGTDCGRCMSVCPYSHPDNFAHNIIRWGISNSFLFQKTALILDHFFYGRKPKLKGWPHWLQV